MSWARIKIILKDGSTKNQKHSISRINDLNMSQTSKMSVQLFEFVCGKIIKIKMQVGNHLVIIHKTIRINHS